MRRPGRRRSRWRSWRWPISSGRGEPPPLVSDRTREIAHQGALPTGRVAILPGIVRLEETGPAFLALALPLGLDRAEAIMIVDVEDVNGIRLGQSPVAADDHHVLVVRVRGLEAHVVAAEDHVAIVRAGIDHDQLVMDNGSDRALRRQLLAEIG